MGKIKINAVIENLEQVVAFVDNELEKHNCPIKIKIQIDVAVEEIFVNIANYAYGENIGDTVMDVEVSENPKRVSIKFIDSGIPFNPLEREDPDITLSAEERQIGGLGIYMVKKSMENMEYEYKNGQNILTIMKTLQ